MGAPSARAEIVARTRFDRIAQLIHSDLAVNVHEPALKVADLFDADPLLDGIAALDESRVGLVGRNYFLGRLRGKFGFALYEKRSVAEHVRYDCLKVDAAAAPVQVITLAMQRPAESIYDDIVVLDEGRFRGLVSMRFLMAHSKDLLAASMAELDLLEERNNALQRINEMQKQFVANMTHELRSPLNAMIGIAQVMMEDERVPEHRRHDLSAITRRGLDLLAIVNDMLDYYKIESGEMKPYIEPTDLPDLVADVLDSARYLIRQKPVELKSESALVRREWKTDPVFVRRILTNLVSNAVKFTEKGCVCVKTTEEGGALVLKVHDTGVGVHPDDRECMFGKFTQLDQGKTKRYGGTGLGLSIVKELTELLGGGIDVESEYGRGTCFTVRLPEQTAVVATVSALERKTV